jgi:hypothetical protein
LRKAAKAKDLLLRKAAKAKDLLLRKAAKAKDVDAFDVLRLLFNEATSHVSKLTSHDPQERLAIPGHRFTLHIQGNNRPAPFA